MKLIDTHIHLDFYDNASEIKRQIVDCNIQTIFVTHLPELFGKYLPRYATNPNVTLALGYHPILVDEYDLNIPLFKSLLKYADFVGEVGLDYSTTSSQISRSKQRDAFSTICSNTSDQILSIHSRLAERDVLKILKDCGVKHAIFHWYTGNEKLIEDIVQQGYYFSVNPMMLRTNKGINVLKQIPNDRLLIETDGPFTKFDGCIVSPNALGNIYNRFSDFYQIDDFKQLVWGNFSTLMKHCGPR